MPGTINITLETRTQRLMPPEAAAFYVGGKTILDRLEKAGWIKPKVNSRKLKRYDLRDLDHCIDRLGDEELP